MFVPRVAEFVSKTFRRHLSPSRWIRVRTQIMNGLNERYPAQSRSELNSPKDHQTRLMNYSQTKSPEQNNRSNLLNTKVF